MCHCLHHRGPDQDGLHLKGNCGLAHKRLSIIDLSTGGQPIYNEDGSCCIIFNGEIYNYKTLREDLMARGHVFRTRSDTEAILHLYEEQGERCVEALRGMFAFAIWNERTQELLLARDRVGKKPLYYMLNDESFLFASEIKSLLADPSVGREIDLEALDEYMTLQYIGAPRTIFVGIRKLPPAHTLLWRRGRITLRRYWALEYGPKQAMSEEEAGERLSQALDDAVRVRLESEVPLGCLLSGGIDSSAVVAFMRRHITGPLRTFSIGFEEAAFNELPFARSIARQFDTIHEEYIVRPNTVEVLPRLVWHLDEPFADSSALPTYYVAEITRRQVTVALNGDGGDESFAGYTRYRGARIVENYKKIPRLIRHGLIRSLTRISGAVAPGSTFMTRLRYVNDISLLPPDLYYSAYMTIFNADQRSRLYGERLRTAGCGHDPLAQLLATYNQQPDPTAPVDRMLATDVANYLPGDLLVKMDRMCMAHSLEARSPFLDHPLMELAATLPAEFKLHGQTLKYILKRALEPILPREILHRPKQGFGVPLERWFKEDLQPYLRDLLLSSTARGRGLFRTEQIERLLDEHTHGRHNHYHRLWSLLCLEVWCRTYLDRPHPDQDPIRL